MSIIDTDSARASRIRLAHVRQELLSPVNALLGYAQIMQEEASREGRQDILPDVDRVLRAARDLARWSELCRDEARDILRQLTKGDHRVRG